ncbi:sugar-transfer associated ATP-grasp domain-containing protein [Roseovarius sp. CH_XMU1461]|uniref:sugar-transfer associated ATP-grasp domain-containing protein n=1 Tax=Roseovarius sp. CH_XMU1461 TaxID=3107777 RepID=UPI0030092721
MSDTVLEATLLEKAKKPKSPAAELIVEVAREHKVSPFRQMREMLSLNFGSTKLSFDEYYSNGVYHPDLNSAQKRQFVGEKGSYKLNCRLSPLKMTLRARSLISDKVLYSALIKSLGFSTTRTQAALSKHRSHGNITTLRSAQDLSAFLRQEARYPLFVKPTVGSGSVGSALITSYDEGRDEIIMANGSQAPVSDFAETVAKDYGSGFLLQDAVAQHPDLSAVIGQAVGTLRIATVFAEDGAPHVLYALWKIPSPDAMSDNYWQSGSMIAELDATTGEIQQCRRGAGPSREEVLTHPVSGRAFRGLKIPHWDKVIEITTQAHQLYPNFGVFGWDIAVTEEGPLIIECNANPHHMLYQLATGRGIYNEDFAPVLDQVIGRSKRLLSELTAERKEERKKH